MLKQRYKFLRPILSRLEYGDIFLTSTHTKKILQGYNSWSIIAYEYDTHQIHQHRMQNYIHLPCYIAITFTTTNSTT